MELTNKVCEESVGLLMTYRCNLDCKYCYIKTKQNKDMTLEMAQSILEPFLLKEAGPVDITFVGGETLMAINVIRPLVEWAKNGKWHRKFRFVGSTNGTLLNDELKDWLRDNRSYITLGLSYDGLPSAQENNRCDNEIDLDFFIENWPKQPIQMTINTETVNSMADGVIYLLEKGAVVHPNVAFEEKEWTNDKIIEYANQLDKLIYYYEEHRNYPTITQFSHDLNEYADSLHIKNRHSHVCGVGNGLQIFDTDGQCYPCHILSPLVLKGDKLQKIRQGFKPCELEAIDERCINCPYYSSCPTCMGSNFLYRGELHRRDLTHCLIMKVEVKAFIKKETRRLLRKDKLTASEAKVVRSIKLLLDYERERLNKG